MRAIVHILRKGFIMLKKIFCSVFLFLFVVVPGHAELKVDIVAGDVSLTNLAAGATAATVDFGALDLAAGKTFPVRVWTHSGPVANDKINVGQYVNNGGELVPMLVDGAAGEKIPGGTKLFVGKIAKDSPLPKVPARWGAAREPIDGDDAFDMLTMKTFKGLQVILR